MSFVPVVNRRNPAESRDRLIASAIGLMLRQGFAATSVDRICEEAGLTKGAFFHHFPTKEELGKAAVESWGAHGTALYSEAWDDESLDPLEQLHRMLEIMASFTEDPEEPCVCMVGMLSQELSRTHPEIRGACDRELGSWNRNVARLLAAAKEKHGAAEAFEPEQVAWFLNSLWHGSMLVAKTRGDQAIIRANLALARRFIDGLFQPPKPAGL